VNAGKSDGSVEHFQKQLRFIENSPKYQLVQITHSAASATLKRSWKSRGGSVRDSMYFLSSMRADGSQHMPISICLLSRR